jgi:hypothetical protein
MDDGARVVVVAYEEREEALSRQRRSEVLGNVRKRDLQHEAHARGPGRFVGQVGQTAEAGEAGPTGARDHRRGSQGAASLGDSMKDVAHRRKATGFDRAIEINALPFLERHQWDV